MWTALRYLILPLLVVASCGTIPETGPVDRFPEEGLPADGNSEPIEVRARKNKSSSWATYEAYTVDRVAGFVPGQEPETDRYGGWKVAALEATGFFRVEKLAGRWWMVTPEGNLFLGKGVAVFKNGQSERQKQALAEKFGTKTAWAQQEISALKSLGFNSLGAWSDVETVRNLEEPIPYTVIVSPMGKLNGHIKSSGEEASASWSGWEGYPNDFAMVFHPEFDSYIEKEISAIAKYRDDPYCIGYFTDNEIPWKNYALDRCLEKWPEDHINHIEAQKWLDERKGKTGASLSEATDADRRAFIAYCLEVYLQKVSAAIEKYDPNHLYLGCRFNQWNYELSNDEIFRSAGKYMDVISVNHYQKWQPDVNVLKDWERWSSRPCMITEFYVKGEDSELPNNTGAGWNVRTQDDRGVFYQNFVMELLKSGTCVGWHWFTYMDNDPEDTTTDPSNRDSNKGIVTWDFNYYMPAVDRMNVMNENIYPLARFFDNGN